MRIEEVALPKAGRGQVLIRIHAAGLNPVDYKIRNGSMRLMYKTRLPMIPGFDVAGTIEQAGKRSGFSPGDRVFAAIPSKGGGYAEFVATAEKYVCRIPEGLSMAGAAAVPLAALTAYQALRKTNSLKPGKQLLINGASGGVGSFAVQIAKAMGAVVTGVCSTPKLDLVRQLGADHVFDYTAGDFSRTGERFDTVFDAVAKSSFGRCRRILKKDGRFISTVPNHGLFWHMALNVFRSKKAGVILFRPSGTDLGAIAGMIGTGAVRPVIEQSFPLEQAAEAHRRLETEKVSGKLVLLTGAPDH